MVLPSRIAASNPNSTEQARINQALDWLLFGANDWEAEQCAIWYDLHAARQSTLFGTIKVNHWADAQGIGASRLLIENSVAVHVNSVTGPDFSPEFLGLLLFAEWQHIDDSGASESEVEVRLKAFRQRVGLTDLHPEFQHGPSEPGN